MSPKSLLALPLLAVAAAGCGAAAASTVTVTTQPHHHRPSGGGSPSTTTASVASTQTTTTTTATTPPRCTVSQLSVRQTSSNGAAGSIGLTYAFTNISGSTCSLFGYPGMLMLNASGKPLPTTVVRAPSVVVPAVSEHTVVLAPNAIASFYAGYSDVSASSCPQASRLEVTPPNAYDHLVISTSIAPCRGRINVSPVFAGKPSV
jgi:hypothetical protein